MPEKQTGVTFEKDVLLWETIQQYSLEPLLTFKSKFPKERRLLPLREESTVALFGGRRGYKVSGRWSLLGFRGCD